MSNLFILGLLADALRILDEAAHGQYRARVREYSRGERDRFAVDRALHLHQHCRDTFMRVSRLQFNVAIREVT